jgi:general secretion pathway protein K
MTGSRTLRRFEHWEPTPLASREGSPRGGSLRASLAGSMGRSSSLRGDWVEISQILASSSSRRAERGVVLLVVLFFALMLAGSVATFLARSTVDAMISRNRDAASSAEALARGGIHLGEALLLEDRLREAAGASLPLDTEQDRWAQGLDLETPSGARLRVKVQDTGSRLNLNALFEISDDGGFAAKETAEDFLLELLAKAIDEVPRPPGEKLYEVRELAGNLIDFVDSDEIRVEGGDEDAWYQSQSPPYRAANRPLFSVDELRLVEGFDADLVEALRPYISVYPYAPGGCEREQVGCGINLNTAPPHVLSLLYYNDQVELRLAPEDVVRKILELRQKGESICPPSQQEEACTPIEEIVANAVFPPPTWTSDLFVVTAEARVGEVRRVIEAVVDRSQGTAIRRLAWRIR